MTPGSLSLLLPFSGGVLTLAAAVYLGISAHTFSLDDWTVGNVVHYGVVHYAQMYLGRLWINRLSRAAVLRPQLGSFFVHMARINPSILKLLTAKIVSSG